MLQRTQKSEELKAAISAVKELKEWDKRWSKKVGEAVNLAKELLNK